MMGMRVAYHSVHPWSFSLFFFLIEKAECSFRTTLCLQFQPDQIAAGAIFLAARFLKMKLPSDSPTLWWRELNVTPRQLHEISCQIMELYEQNRAGPSSQTSEAEGSSAGGSQRPPLKVPPGNVEHFACSSPGGGTSKVSLEPEMLVPDQPHADSHSGPPSMTQTRSSDDYGTSVEGKQQNDHASGSQKTKSP